MVMQPHLLAYRARQSVVLQPQRSQRAVVAQAGGERLAPRVLDCVVLEIEISQHAVEREPLTERARPAILWVSRDKVTVRAEVRARVARVKVGLRLRVVAGPRARVRIRGAHSGCSPRPAPPQPQHGMCIARHVHGMCYARACSPFQRSPSWCSASFTLSASPRYRPPRGPMPFQPRSSEVSGRPEGSKGGDRQPWRRLLPGPQPPTGC